MIAPRVGFAAPVAVHVVAAPSGDVIVIDLRPAAPTLTAARAQLLTALAVEGVPVRQGADVDAALSGAAPAATVPGAADLARAATAFGGLDCVGATAAADQAIAVLAAEQVVRADDPTGLRQAWAYRFLCADRIGDFAATQRAAARLRTLGVVDGSEMQLPPAAWAATPAIDAATDRDIISVTLHVADGDGVAQPLPADAVVWIDHARATPTATPTGDQWFVPAGTHVVAVAAGAVRGALVHAVIDERHGTVVVPIAAAPVLASTPLTVAAAAVIRARAADATPDVRATAFTEALVALGATRAVVLRNETAAEIWQLIDGRARKQATTPIAARRLVQALAAESADDEPLLVDDAGHQPRYGRKPSSAKWWVYASIAGAIAVGTTVLLVAGSGDDVQHIEVHGP